MKKTLEWTAPDRTVVDSISVLTLGLETLISRIGAIDAREAANAGALGALESSVRMPLRDVVDDSLEWVGDVDDVLQPEADLRRAARGLERGSDNVYASLTQLKDIAHRVRKALAEAVDGVSALDGTAPDLGQVASFSHVYHQNRRSRIERVINRPPTDTSVAAAQIVFTEVSPGSPRSAVGERSRD